MYKKNLFILLFSTLISCAAISSPPSKETPADLVNVFIDSYLPRFDYFISASTPHGLVSLSPDTKHGNLWNSGYRYDDTHILSFSHIHNAQTAGIPVKWL